jgi:hypothetical protein
MTVPDRRHSRWPSPFGARAGARTTSTTVALWARARPHIGPLGTPTRAWKGRAYMAAIRPVGHLIVYLAAIRQIGREWRKCTAGQTPLNDR